MSHTIIMNYLGALFGPLFQKNMKKKGIVADMSRQFAIFAETSLKRRQWHLVPTIRARAAGEDGVTNERKQLTRKDKT